MMYQKVCGRRFHEASAAIYEVLASHHKRQTTRCRNFCVVVSGSAVLRGASSHWAFAL